MHPILKRQLGRLNLDAEQVPTATAQWRALLERVDQSYNQADQERYTLERSLLISSREMRELYETLEVHSQSRLEREKDKLQAIFNSTVEGIIVTDCDGYIVNANPAYCDTTGYSLDQLVGDNPRKLKSGRHDAAFYATIWSDITTSGQWRGEMWNRRSSGECYPQSGTISAIRDEAGTITHFVGVFSDVTELRRSQQQLDHLANHDPLTGLPNRRLCYERLEHLLNSKRRDNDRVALLFLDLDGFKAINDTLGHPAGDELLEKVADRLRHAVREQDIVARLGGDEFLIILEQLDDPALATGVSRKVQAALARPFKLNGRELIITTSIGISLFPQDASDVTNLVRNADIAMYRAKAAGRNLIRYYTEEMTVAATERFALEQELRLAVARNELELWFQPQQRLGDGVITGAEALLRWRNPRRGLVMPNDFIPLAEETGLIKPIGDWVISTACQAAAHWPPVDGQPLRISVNLCGDQLLVSGFTQKVKAALINSGLQAERLELEITEGSLVQYSQTMVEVLNGLRELGVTIALDDFGTGYSSLSYLKSFPFDALKVDRAFVRDIDQSPYDIAIAKAVMTLGQSLRLRTVAEGVETDVQRQTLVGLGCEEVQGFLYSPAVPPAEFLGLLETSPD